MHVPRRNLSHSTTFLPFSPTVFDRSSPLPYNSFVFFGNWVILAFGKTTGGTTGIMKLTRRQQDFLGKFLDLYRQAKRPLHYTDVAEHLGVRPLSAYDMLRLLEERGLVKSEFVVKEGRGRSSVVFSPTPKAEALMSELAGDAWEQEEWETVKARILHALEEGKGSDYRDLLDDLILRLDEPSTPMIYTTRMITAILLALHQLKEGKREEILEHLRHIGFPEEVGLYALSGLTMGLTLAERINRRIRSRLLAAVVKYQGCLGRLSQENKRRLSEFTAEALRIINKES